MKDRSSYIETAPQAKETYHQRRLSYNLLHRQLLVNVIARHDEFASVSRKYRSVAEANTYLDLIHINLHFQVQPSPHPHESTAPLISVAEHSNITFSLRDTIEDWCDSAPPPSGLSKFAVRGQQRVSGETAW